MAAQKKTEDEEQTEPRKTSMVVQALVFLVVTAIAAGAGFGVSMLLKPAAQDMAREMNAKTAENTESGEDHPVKLDEHGDPIEEEGDGKGEGAMKQSYAKQLAPILTNLAAPSDVWVRMELAVVGERDLTDEVLELVHQDLFAYMRTVKLHQVEGPSGYINLKAELSERAAIRSGGVAKMVLVRTLVFE